MKIEVEMAFLNSAATLGCYFQDGADAGGNPVWSQDGCTFDSVDTERSVVTCKCNHLTRFTSLEDSDDDNTEAILRTPAIVEDNTDFSNMPIMFYIACVIWIVMIVTMIIDKFYAVKD